MPVASSSSAAASASTSAPVPATAPLNGSRAIYPPNVVPNPAASLPADRVDAVLGPLQRPEFIPGDLDERIVRSSVWMKTVPSTGTQKSLFGSLQLATDGTPDEVRFFVPNSCQECLVGKALCDRDTPSCSRCARLERTCVPGDLLVIKMNEPPAPPPRAPQPAPLRSPDKGKGRAVPGADSDDNESADEREHGHEHEHDHDHEHDADTTEGGRGKRVRKKRRLSASDELDPNLLNFDGTGLRKPRSRVSRVAHHLPPAHSGPLRPEDVVDKDTSYRDAVVANDAREALGDMRGFCPAWTDRRRALFTAAEYLRNPISTTGASVDIGASGLARGVILEGHTISPAYWGEGRMAGTIVAPIGEARRKAPDAAASGPPPSPTRPPATIADELNMAMKSTDEPEGIARIATAATASTSNGTTASVPAETAPVEALLMANRARTPVALAVGHDYPGVPFKVPRALVVLGWFWITEAWTEPVGLGGMVVWKFTFEWCTGIQKQPWWTPKSSTTEREPTPAGQVEGDVPAWPVRGPGIAHTTTLRGAQTQQPPPAGLGDGQDYRQATLCPACNTFSDQVYASRHVCLNEKCTAYFGDASNRELVQETIGAPAPCRPDTRILPESLRLSLAPPGPSTKFSDVQRHDAQRDFWRAWVCKRCRSANERRDWFGYLCEACALIDKPKRKVYTSEALAPAARLPCTGARPDDGFASWTVDASRDVTQFPDCVKVLAHTVTLPSRATIEVSHALSSEPMAAHAHTVFMGFQRQGRDEVPLRREYLSASSSRAANLALSPFYTLLCGPDNAPFTAHFPTGEAVAWSDAPRPCGDAMDLISERVGRVYPDHEPFNSLLTAAMPGALWKVDMAVSQVR